MYKIECSSFISIGETRTYAKRAEESLLGFVLGFLSCLFIISLWLPSWIDIEDTMLSKTTTGGKSYKPYDFTI